jgi:pimeloyl-ACP methyl ester carboxylesterase
MGWSPLTTRPTWEEQQRLEDAIPAARLKPYPETGHSPHWERPERVAADLATVIRP